MNTGIGFPGQTASRDIPDAGNRRACPGVRMAREINLVGCFAIIDIMAASSDQERGYEYLECAKKAAPAGEVASTATGDGFGAVAALESGAEAAGAWAGAWGMRRAASGERHGASGNRRAAIGERQAASGMW